MCPFYGCSSRISFFLNLVLLSLDCLRNGVDKKIMGG
jgi:hypothetical protein